MSAIYEITDTVQSYVYQSCWYMEVQNDTGANGNEMDTAVEPLIDNIADDVWSDLEILIEGWLDRHGERYKEDLLANVMVEINAKENDDYYTLED